MKQSLLLTVIFLGTLVGCTKKDPNFGVRKATPGQITEPGQESSKTAPTEEKPAAVATTDSNQCAIDLCGPAEKRAEFSGGGALLAKSLETSKPFFTNEVQPLLERNFSAIGEVVKSEELHALMDELKTARLDASQKSLIVSLGLLKIFMFKHANSELDIISSDGKGNTIINRENAVKAFPEWTPDQIYDATATLNALMASNFYKSFMGWSGMALEAYLQGSKSQDRATAIKKLAQYIDDVKLKLGEAVYWRFDMSAYDALKAGKELKDWQKKEVMSIITTTFLYMGALTPHVRELMPNIKLSIQDIENELKKISAETRKKSKIDFSQSPESIRQQVMASCQTGVAQLLATAVSEEKLKTHQKTIDFVKGSAQKAAKKYLEGESLEAALNAIQTATFLNPPNETTLREGLTAKMFATAKKSRELLLWAEKMSKPDAKNWQFFVGTLIINDFDQEPTFGERMIADACEALKPGGPTDRAMESGAIQVGWQTVAFPEIGAGIIAHELGHVVSNAVAKKMGNQGYADVRMCTSSAHEMLGMENGAAMLYSEEDWADVFAASVLKDVNQTWPYGQNFTCSLIRIDEVQKRYGATELWDKPTLDGSHSQSLFRSLLVHTTMGKELPASCQQMIAKSSAKTLPVCGK